MSALYVGVTDLEPGRKYTVSQPGTAYMPDQSHWTLVTGSIVETGEDLKIIGNEKSIVLTLVEGVLFKPPFDSKSFKNLELSIPTFSSSLFLALQPV